LWIAGAGPHEGELRRAARDLDNVRFAGQLDHQELADLFRCAHLVIVPSLFPETFCYVALEAMAVGIPVVARAIGALPEVLDQAGLTYRNEEELSGIVGRLLDHPEERDALGSAAESAARSRYSEHDHLTRYFELIERCREIRG